jgi:hypothetical protein
VRLDFAFAHELGLPAVQLVKAFHQVKGDDWVCSLCPQKQHSRNFPVAHDMNQKTIILTINEI